MNWLTVLPFFSISFIPANNYRGCYCDDSTLHDLSDLKIFENTLTPDTCIEHCYSLNFIFSGLQVWIVLFLYIKKSLHVSNNLLSKRSRIAKCIRRLPLNQKVGFFILSSNLLYSCHSVGSNTMLSVPCTDTVISFVSMTMYWYHREGMFYIAFESKIYRLDREDKNAFVDSHLENMGRLQSAIVITNVLVMINWNVVEMTQAQFMLQVFSNRFLFIFSNQSNHLIL